MATDLLNMLYLNELDTPPEVTYDGAFYALDPDHVAFHADLVVQPASYPAATPAAGPLTVTLSAGQSAAISLYWVSGEFGRDHIIYEDTNSYELYLDVLTANTDVVLDAVYLMVIDSTGARKTTIKSSTNDITLDTAGVVPIVMYSTNINDYNVLATDRLALVFLFINANTHTGSPFDVAGSFNATNWDDSSYTREAASLFYGLGKVLPLHAGGNIQDAAFATSFTKADYGQTIDGSGGFAVANDADTAGGELIVDPRYTENSTGTLYADARGGYIRLSTGSAAAAGG